MKDHIKATGVGHRAFLPSNKNLQKSVFFIDNWNEGEIWECGRWVEAQQRATNPDTELRARGDVAVAAVIEAGLAVEPDTTHHPRHANIIGWPAEKEQRAAKAQFLADRATLVKLPQTPPEE